MWIVNILNGFIGFGGFVGVGVCIMFYCLYIKENGKFIKSIVWMIIVFINGLVIFLFFGFIGILDMRFILYEKLWLWFVFIFFVFFVFIYIGFFKLKNRKVT